GPAAREARRAVRHRLPPEARRHDLPAGVRGEQLERDQIGTNRRSRWMMGIAASAAPPRNDGVMVIANAAKQSPALCAGIAASAAPPRNDGSMVIASAAKQS